LAFSVPAQAGTDEALKGIKAYCKDRKALEKIRYDLQKAHLDEVVKCYSGSIFGKEACDRHREKIAGYIRGIEQLEKKRSPADFNKDLKIDALDIEHFSGCLSFSNNGSDCRAADFNGDGSVTLSDATAFTAHKGCYDVGVEVNCQLPVPQ